MWETKFAENWDSKGCKLKIIMPMKAFYFQEIDVFFFCKMCKNKLKTEKKKHRMKRNVKLK